MCIRDRVSNSAQKINLALRGLYGEGSRALGDFYQVSNQFTLGKAERVIRKDVHEAVKFLIDSERTVRDALVEGESRGQTLDRVHRALGTLENARILSSEECLSCLSAIRFGVDQGVVDGVSLHALNRILLHAQPGHLQLRAESALDATERDLLRAELVREILADPDGSSAN